MSVIKNGRRRTALRVGAVAVLSAAPALALAAPAHAQTSGGRVGNALVINAQVNRANNITINRVANNFVVTELGDVVQALPGCVVLNAHQLRCSAVGVAQLRVSTGNLNDRVTNNTTTRSVTDGGSGNDTLIGGSSADTLTGGFGIDTLFGRGGNDTSVALTINDGRDSFLGGAGSDTADYSRRVARVSVSLNGVANDGALGENDNNLADVENATGGRGNDTLVGNASANSLNGGSGNDTLIGLGGNDRLTGGFGQDTMFGDAGNDTAVALRLNDGADRFFGGAGVDTTSYAARSVRVLVSLNNVANDGQAGEGDNNRSDVENAIGGSGNDVLSGNTARNNLQGRAGNDIISTLDARPLDVANGGANVDRCFTDAGDLRISCELS